MNEFGTPFGFEADTMLPPGSIKPHERFLAESGMEMHLTPGAGIAIGAAIGAVGSIIGGSQAASAGRKAAKAQNEAVQRQYEYDIQAWNMGKDKLRADWEAAREGIAVAERNEHTIAAFHDATNSQRYNHDVMIRNREQESLNEQYVRSHDIYLRQRALNQWTQEDAQNQEIHKYQEAHAEAAFENQELILKNLLARSTARAVPGRAGRSALKTEGSYIAERGRAQEIMAQSLVTGELDLESMLAELSKDKYGADLAAFAQKMLHPGTLPEIIKPMKTPVAEFLYPRPLAEYDYGPQPVHGAFASGAAASQMAWAGAIQGVAGAVGGAFSAYGAGKMKPSDIELKENIELVDRSESGLNIYEWNYLDEPSTRYRGLIAQDLLANGYDDLVVELDNGYLGVYYDKSDVNMTQV